MMKNYELVCNVATNETTEIAIDDIEMDRRNLAAKNAQDLKDLQATELKDKKDTLLNRLGITADEAKLLLS